MLVSLLQNSRFREGRQLKKVELEKAVAKKPRILRSLSLVAGDRSGECLYHQVVVCWIFRNTVKWRARFECLRLGSFSGTIESADTSPSEADGSPVVKFKTRAPSDRLCLSGKVSGCTRHCRAQQKPHDALSLRFRTLSCGVKAYKRSEVRKGQK